MQTLLDDDLHERHYESRIGSRARTNPHIGFRRDERVVRIDNNQLRPLLLAGQQVRHAIGERNARVQSPDDVRNRRRGRRRHALGYVVHVVAPHLLMPERHRIIGRRNNSRPLHDVEQAGEQVPVLRSMEKALPALAGEHACNTVRAVLGHSLLDLAGYLGDRLFPGDTLPLPTATGSSLNAAHRIAEPMLAVGSLDPRTTLRTGALGPGVLGPRPLLYRVAVTDNNLADALMAR